MEDIKKEVRAHDLLGRWRSMDERWEAFAPVDALYIENGVEDDDVRKLKTAAFQNWLLRFESINSLLVVTRKTLVFFAAPDSTELYAPFVAEARAQGREIVLVPRQDKALDGRMNATAFFEEIRRLRVTTLGVLANDRHKGRLVEVAKELLGGLRLTTVDVSRNVQELLCVKDSTELALIEKCAHITIHFFEKLTRSIELILENNRRETHSAISKSIDDFLTRARQKLAADFGANPSFYDFSYSPVIQSGGRYDLKPTAESDNETLQQDCILLSLGGKYCELNCNIYRALLINPNEEEKNAYNALLALHRLIISELVAGRRLADIHRAGQTLFEHSFPALVAALPVAFGFGIGYEFRESCLAIRADTEKTVSVGNVFAVITSLKGLKGFGGKEYALQLGDTVLVCADGPVNITVRAPIALEDVAYRFDEEEEETAEPITVDVETRGRTRHTRRQEVRDDQERMQNMRDHQRELLALKDAELRERLITGNFHFRVAGNTKPVLEKIQTYTAETFPRGYNPKLIAVDVKNAAVLLPINNALVPFHISCLKNVTRHQDARNCSLRFNFHTPGISSALVFPTTATIGGDPIYIKELFFKSVNVEALNQALRLIKELQRKQKLNQAIEDDVEEERVALRGKLRNLDDLKMRPPLAGKKTIGALTAFANGFRFQSKRGEAAEIPLSNIRHAIYQRCDDNMIVLLHFALRRPMLINKKMTHHLQFYAEVGYTSEDLTDNRRRNRGGEREELEEEELEERAREHYNALFDDFVAAVERGWERAEGFETPFPELGFHGSSSYNNVFIMPTQNSLVSLVETPFLCIAIEDIELVSIERVDNKIKNFDLIVVFKDYTAPVQSLRNIPKTHLEALKRWLDEQNILILEGGTMNLKWDEVLKKIRGNLEEFVLREGGWQGFFDEEDSPSDKSFAGGSGEDSVYEGSAEEDSDDEFSASELYDEEEEEGEDEEEESEAEVSEEESARKAKANRPKKSKA